MADPQPDPPAETEGRSWGILLDVAGLIAAALLVVIVFDIWSDGRISGRLAARKQPQPQPEGTDGAGPAG